AFFTSFSILFSLGILVKILMEQVLLICCAYFSTGSVPTALLRPNFLPLTKAKFFGIIAYQLYYYFFA
ncbi:MAG: hypothetical protein M1355_02325, partial [Patescibacteria group bacterium]|nr:hypothetical protein [Patescibacteria group bacterium]